MAQLGIPATVVINMLYKQIIMTKSIPFPLSVPSVPAARDEMDTATFNAMMVRGLEEVVDYIASVLQEPLHTLHMLDSLEAEIASLSSFPGRVALTEEEPWHSLGIHKLPVKN